MCDPMVGIALSIASAGLSYMQQQSAANMQQQVNDEWISYQRQKSQEEWKRQEDMRQKAELARGQAVTDLAPDKQKEAQATEEQRLTKEMAPDQTPEQQAQLVGDQMLSGQKGASSQITGTFANQLTQASKDARARIQALATLSSYTGSQFGLQNRAKDILGTSGQVIGLEGNKRQGSLGVYQAEKAVPPAKVVQSASPFSGIASSLGGMAGRGFGASLAGTPAQT
jgi:hypothetical protein